MPTQEKYQLLNETIRPFGYRYLSPEDIFISTFDAWQREFGYTYSYDRAAPYFNMVFDCEPIYFTYQDRTWLVEFWKGQYGINTGAEAGIYCADTIVPPSQRKRELFHTVKDEDIPVFSIRFQRHTAGRMEELACLSVPHWWLAIFRMGCFSYPADLFTEFCIKFPKCDMADAFVDALITLGYPECAFKACGARICLYFKSPLTIAPDSRFTRFIRELAQWESRILCQLYLFVTRHFCATSDRLIYLYFYLPFVFRRCLCLGRAKKCPHYRRHCKRKEEK